MTYNDIKDTVIKQGLCKYGMYNYKVYICISDIFPGTGDYEDPPEIADDWDIECYCI